MPAATSTLSNAPLIPSLIWYIQSRQKIWLVHWNLANASKLVLTVIIYITYGQGCIVYAENFLCWGGGGQDYLQYSPVEKQARERSDWAGGCTCGIGCPPSHSEGAFAFRDWNWTIWCTLWVDFLGNFQSKKVRRKYIFMEGGKCVCSHTGITGNVKSKHKQYHWHSQDFSTSGGPKWGSKVRERSDRAGEGVVPR